MRWRRPARVAKHQAVGRVVFHLVGTTTLLWREIASAGWCSLVVNGETLIVKRADYINWAFSPAPLLINIRVLSIAVH